MLVAGIGAAVVATCGPIDAIADRVQWAHAIQHLALQVVAAPLFVAGAPLHTLLAALPSSIRPAVARVTAGRIARAVLTPAAGWCAFVASGWIVHYSPLFDAALARPIVHAGEHGLLFGAAALFWWPVFGSPDMRRLGHLARVGYIAAAVPPTALLALTIYQAPRVLYAHYAGAAGALADQQAAGEIMWICGGAALVIAAAIAAVAWVRVEIAVARAEEAS